MAWPDVDGYIYDEGTHEDEWVAGYSNDGGSQSKESDHLLMEVDRNNSNPVRTWVTDSPIDLTNVDDVIFEWQGLSSSGGATAVHRVAASTSKGGQLAVFDAEFTRNATSFSRTTDTLDVSGLSGSYYIRFHIFYNSSVGTRSQLIYRVRVDPPPQPPPPKVTNLTATADGPFAIDLSWDAADGADNYDIERDSSIIETEHETLTYKDTGRTPATQYTYRVRGVNAEGPGEWSDPVQATTDELPVLGRAAESESAQPFTATKALPLGRATETAQALSIGSAKARAFGAAAEAELVQGIGTSLGVGIGQVTETESARTFGASKSAAIGRVSESEASRPIGNSKAIPFGTARETEATGPITFVRAYPIGVAVESESLSVVTASKSMPFEHATETETARRVRVVLPRDIVYVYGKARHAPIAIGSARHDTMAVGKARHAPVAEGKARHG